MSHPQSTYRLQLHGDFTFRDATAIVPYLAKLGITHLYASPYLRARPGSRHGYDVIDPTRLNPELGSPADFDAMCDALAGQQMGQVLDIVPNHMGVATNDNAWWNDVLRHGRASKYAAYFDIAWDESPRPELQGKLLLPVLGGPYAQVLEGGELKLARDADGLWVYYHDRRFPIDPATTGAIDDPDRLNGTPGEPASFDALHALLERQHYRLTHWKNAVDEINYRRFFDVSDLAALAMERQEVFEDAHALILRLVAEGKVTGLRIDHPDGLYDPAQYFQRLQQAVGHVSPRQREQDSSGFYVIAEKILALDEPLVSTWPIAGTSGYDFLNMVNGLFVDPAAGPAFTDTYRAFTGRDVDYDQLVYEKKKLILERSLASELHLLTLRLDRLAQRHRGWRDFTLATLRLVLRETIACFGVYRTYINSPTVAAADRAHVERAIAAAMRRNPDIDALAFEFLRDVLLQRYPVGFDDADRAAQLAFAGKFQQLTSPTTAKGVEDTAFYVYNRFVSLNEVGGEPGQFGVAADRLHAWLADRQRHWPAAISTLSTHDTKRSEDVRVRLNVLGEMPDEWRQRVLRWRDLGDRHRHGPAPTANDEYLLYQTLVGAWPLQSQFDRDAFTQRIQQYMQKALREGKENSSWTAPDAAYEAAVADFAAALIDAHRGREFLADFLPFVERVMRLGLVNSLAQAVLKLTAPGVPDTYQGTELWDFSLVDPDNRRPVDFAQRRAMLEALDAAWAADPVALANEVMGDMTDGRVKLLVTSRLLRARRALAPLFTEGGYMPLDAGTDALFAFARQLGNRLAVVVVPIRPTRLAEARQAGVTLPQPPVGRGFRNLLSGAAVEPADAPLPIDALLGPLPVAVLAAAPGEF